MTDKTTGEKIYHCPFCPEKYTGLNEIKAHVLDRHGTASAPRPQGVIRLTINGQAYEERVEPEWTLYELIHDKLGLIGVKMFCDRGSCGACTVIMDGRPILSCMTLAVECDGKTIETVEGIAAAGHPLIEEYVSHHAMQCGYCTPGFVVTAKALLDRNPECKEEDIREAMAGNLCRCGTYPQHPKAVLAAAGKLKNP